jgi:hypothetical protein
VGERERGRAGERAGGRGRMVKSGESFLSMCIKRVQQVNGTVSFIPKSTPTETRKGKGKVGRKQEKNTSIGE